MIYPKFDFGVTLSHVTTITVVKNVSSETVNCTQTKVIHIKYSKQKAKAVRKKILMVEATMMSVSQSPPTVELWTNSGSQGLL